MKLQEVKSQSESLGVSPQAINVFTQHDEEVNVTACTPPKWVVTCLSPSSLGLPSKHHTNNIRALCNGGCT